MRNKKYVYMYMCNKRKNICKKFSLHIFSFNICILLNITMLCNNLIIYFSSHYIIYFSSFNLYTYLI